MTQQKNVNWEPIDLRKPLELPGCIHFETAEGRFVSATFQTALGKIRMRAVQYGDVRIERVEIPTKTIFHISATKQITAGTPVEVVKDFEDVDAAVEFELAMKGDGFKIDKTEVEIPLGTEEGILVGE